MFIRFCFYILFVAVFVSCSSVPSKSDVPAKKADKAVSETKIVPEKIVMRKKLYTPKEFFDIIDKSKNHYILKSADETDVVDFAKSGNPQTSVNPYLRVVYENGSNFSLKVEEPKGEIAELYEQAEEAITARDYKKALALYEKTMSLDENYFKNWTYLGNTYYFLQDYEKAEKYLKKAVEMNDIGYQEYLFLADVYDKTGEKEKSIDAATRAFMFNRNSSNVRIILNQILRKNGLRIRENRLKFHYTINKLSDDSVEIILRKKDNAKYAGIAMCMACWQMEPDFYRLMECNNCKWNAEILKNRECFMGAANNIENVRSKGDFVTQDEKLFVEAILSSYLNSIVYWEVITPDIPRLVLLLPKAEKEKIVEYIKKYVYEKID